MIHRSEHKDSFTVIDNDIIRNTTLPSSAFRLLLFMLSCSDEWEFSITGLSHHFGWDERKTMTAVKALKKAGYVEQIRKRDEKGVITSCEWHIYEEPIVTKTHSVDKPTVWSEPQCGESTYVENPQCGKNAPIRNTNIEEIPNKERLKVKKVPKKAARFVPPTLEEVRAYCQERGNSIDPQRFYDYYSEGNWKDAKGNPVKNWKQKVITWEKKDEGKRAKTEPINENPFTRLRREEGYES